MNARYEVAFSSREPLLKMLLLEGTWESLPFEIRLSQPWRGSSFCAETTVTAAQREEVARQGYSVDRLSIVSAHEPKRPAKPIAANTHHAETTVVEAVEASFAADREILRWMWQSCRELRDMREQSQSLALEARQALQAANRLLH